MLDYPPSYRTNLYPVLFENCNTCLVSKGRQYICRGSLGSVLEFIYHFSYHHAVAKNHSSIPLICIFCFTKQNTMMFYKTKHNDELNQEPFFILAKAYINLPRGSPLGFFNSAIPDKFFSQSRPDHTILSWSIS